MLAIKSINYDTDKKNKNKASLHMDHHTWNYRHDYSSGNLTKGLNFRHV